MSIESLMPTLISAVPGGIVVVVLLWVVDKMNKKDDAREARHAAERQAADKEREERNRTHAAERQAMEAAYRQLATEVTHKMGEIQRETVGTVKVMEQENRQAVNSMWGDSLKLHDSHAQTTLAMSKEVARLAAEMGRMGHDVMLIKASTLPHTADGIAYTVAVSRQTHYQADPTEGPAPPAGPQIDE